MIGRRDGVWWAGLVVAATAAAATAHGLFAVAEASSVPRPVAVLYPVMTDGLALVAYSATNRLADGPRRYAWCVVIAAACLSGGAQALYLASGGLDNAPSTVRFGIGAAPALAAAAVAHLLHLVRTTAASSSRPIATSVQVESVARQRPVKIESPAPPARPDDVPSRRSNGIGANGASAAGRARRAAVDHRAEHGRLPTTSELVELAKVSRGTAGTVLKRLRAEADHQQPDRSPTEPAGLPTRPPTKIQDDHTPMHHDPEKDRQRAAAGVEA